MRSGSERMALALASASGQGAGTETEGQYNACNRYKVEFFSFKIVSNCA